MKLPDGDRAIVDDAKLLESGENVARPEIYNGGRDRKTSENEFMTYRGIMRGKTIELDEPLPFADGQLVRVSVEPTNGSRGSGSPALIRQTMRAAPHLDPEDVDELQRAIASGKQAVRHNDIFRPDV